MGKRVGSALELAQIATPANPAANATALYVKSDGLLYTKSSAGVESAVGSGTTGATGAGYQGITSTSSVAVGTGSKSFTLNKIDALAVGTRVRVASSASPANYMEGSIATISSLTITVTVDNASGTGTFASWTVSVAGDPGRYTTSATLAADITDETGSGSLVFATSPALVTPLLGTPTSGTLTNCTGYTVGNISGLGTGVSTFLGTPTSANFQNAITDNNGTGTVVFGTSPTLVTPVITQGTATSPTFTTNSTTLLLTQQGQMLLASNGATAGAVKIPTNASVAFPVGTQIHIIQTGTGQLTISAVTTGTTSVFSAGATVASPKLRAQYSAATMLKTATDVWYVFGDIA